MISNGQTRAAERLRQVREKNDRLHSGREDVVTRQQRRHPEKAEVLPRSFHNLKPARDRASARILKIWNVGPIEHAFHATKGLRKRRA